MNPIAKALAVAAKYTSRHPTEAQKRAGNYAKGKVTIAPGLVASIENPKGSKRSGVDKNGKKWECVLPSHYGYLLSTEGADRDHLDCYIGSDHSSKTVYVVDQIDAETGKFDEHKCLLSYPNRDAAVADYCKAFSDGKGKARIGSVTEMPLAAFSAWAKNGDTKKPLGELRKAFASGGAVTDILKGVYGEGTDAEEGLDQPYYDTSLLAERMGRYEQVPEWMKAVEPYDAALSHWLQASPMGGYPEALQKQDLPYGPLGTLPWMAAGAVKALSAKPAFDMGKNLAREQLWDDILARGLMPARAEGGQVGREFFLEQEAPDPAPSDFERKLEDYEPLKTFQPYGQAELRGTGPGESRDPRQIVTGERPKDYMAPVAELVSPTLGGYGMGQIAGEVAGNIGEGEYGNAALAAIPLALGAVVPGPDGKPMRVPREIDQRGFYSPSLEASKVVPQEVGTVQQFTSMLLKHGAKPKELDAVGFHRAFPDPNAKVSRQEIEQYLRDNRVQLGETVKGAGPYRINDQNGWFVAEFPTRQEAEAHIQANLYDAVDDGWTDPIGSRGAYESYSTPGGIPGSYREVVTTLPSKASMDLRGPGFRDALAQRFFNKKWDELTQPQQNEAMNRNAEFADTVDYTSSHWPGITNPLLHYRVKDFVDSSSRDVSAPAGVEKVTPSPQQGSGEGSTLRGARGLPETNLPSKVRVLDEMQSDWAQRARDQGFRDPAAFAELEARKQKVADDLKLAEEDAYGMLGLERGRDMMTYPALQKSLDSRGSNARALWAKIDQLRDSYSDLTNKVSAARDGVPSAPYISNTSDWVDLGLKQALIDAARDPSVSRFAWAPGKVQADRYNLAKQVSALRYSPDTGGLQYQGRNPGSPDHWSMLDSGAKVTPENLHEYVGRDVAQEMLAQPRTGDYGGFHTLRLDEARHIGGEGMKSFYGDLGPDGNLSSGIVPTRLLKIIKGLDPDAAKVDSHNINSAYDPALGPGEREMARNNPAWAAAFEKRKQEKAVNYPSVRITPEMRKKILEQGLPLFLTPLGLGLAVEGESDPIMDMLEQHYGEDD